MGRERRRGRSPLVPEDGHQPQRGRPALPMRGEPLETGAPLQVQIALPGLREPMTFKALVMWLQPCASGVTKSARNFKTWKSNHS